MEFFEFVNVQRENVYYINDRILGYEDPLIKAVCDNALLKALCTSLPKRIGFFYGVFCLFIKIFLSCELRIEVLYMCSIKRLERRDKRSKNDTTMILHSIN